MERGSKIATGVGVLLVLASYVSEAVYSMLNKDSKYGGRDKQDMWTALGSADVGIKIYGSNFWWEVP